MDQLIDNVRKLINDPMTCENRRYDDMEIGWELNNTRIWHSKAALTSLTPKMWQADDRYWSDAVLLADANDELLSPINGSDPFNGLFVFDEDQESVFATGFVYDPFGTAAELLTVWAGQLENEIVKFTSDGSTYEFASEAKSKLALAESYKQKSPRYGGIGNAKLVRDDTN